LLELFTRKKTLEESEEKDIIDPKPKAQSSKNLINDFYYGTVEKTFEESSYYEASQRKPYNPSNIYQARGSHKLYDEMRLDDQVSVALQLKKDLVLASGWSIISQDENQEEIISFLNSALNEHIEIPLDQICEDILSAYDFGFS
jgi:hypothetical protein